MYYSGINYASPVIRLNRMKITGTIHFHKKKIRIKTRNIEYCSKKLRNGDKLLGKSAKSILDPSSGGTGTRLKIAKTRLIMTIILIRLTTSPVRVKIG